MNLSCFYHYLNRKFLLLFWILRGFEDQFLRFLTVWKALFALFLMFLIICTFTFISQEKSFLYFDFFCSNFLFFSFYFLTFLSTYLLSLNFFKALFHYDSLLISGFIGFPIGEYLSFLLFWQIQFLYVMCLNIFCLNIVPQSTHSLIFKFWGWKRWFLSL